MLHLHLRKLQRETVEQVSEIPPPITSVSITQHVKRTQSRRDTARVFYADERRFGDDGGGGTESSKQIKMEIFLLLLYQSFLLESGEAKEVVVGSSRKVGGGCGGGGRDVPAVFDRAQS